MDHSLALFAAVAMTAVMGLAASPARAEVVTRTVEYTHEGTTFKGYLAYDDAAEGKRPGVLVVHEWYGLDDYAKRRARELAELGYVALAADMYGGGKVAASREEAARLAGAVRGDAGVMRGRAAAALGALREQPETDPERLGAIGYCFGGTVVLELARSGADLDAAVSFHGGLGTQRPAEKGEVKARGVVFNGAEDPMVPHEERQAFMKEMTAAGVDWQLVEYGHAVHSFSNPNSDKAGIPGVAYNEKADRRSWAAMRQVFEEAFGDE